MGGALALRIAATRPVTGVILVNPGLVIDDPRAPLAGILKLVLKSTPAIANDILKPGMDEGAYPRTPVAAAHELNKMFKDTIRLLPAGHSAGTRFPFDRGPRGLRLQHHGAPPRPDPRPAGADQLENSYHVATLDNDAEQIFRGSVDFIRILAANPPRSPPVRDSQPEGRARE